MSDTFHNIRTWASISFFVSCLALAALGLGGLGMALVSSFSAGAEQALISCPEDRSAARHDLGDGCRQSLVGERLLDKG